MAAYNSIGIAVVIVVVMLLLWRRDYTQVVGVQKKEERLAVVVLL